MFNICILSSLILYFVSIVGDYDLSSGVILAPLIIYFVIYVLTSTIMYLINK